MGEHTWQQPKLVMGYIEVVGPDGEDGIPYDEAVIHLEGDEDSEIEIHCPGALRLAPFIVKACNSHDALVKALEFYAQQFRYDGPNHHAMPNDPYTPDGQPFLQDVTRDGGNIARAALAKVQS